MGEGILIYGLKQKLMSDKHASYKQGMSPLRQHISPRKQAHQALSTHVGKSVSVNLRRRTIDVKFTHNSAKHIAHDITHRHIPIAKEDYQNVLKYLSSSTYHSTSAKDTEGKHARTGTDGKSKDKKKNVDSFVYTSYNYKGTILYFNIASKKSKEWE
jgi:hypothetical protein